MSPTEHEAEIDRLQAAMVNAGRANLRMMGDQFLMAVLARNAERTPEQIAELEQKLGLK
jgi:hypothetical protein